MILAASQQMKRLLCIRLAQKLCAAPMILAASQQMKRLLCIRLAQKFFFFIFHFSFFFHIFAPRNVIGSLYKRLKWESGANPGLSRSCKLPFMVQTNASLNFFGKTFASVTSQKTCLSLLFFPVSRKTWKMF